MKVYSGTQYGTDVGWRVVHYKLGKPRTKSFKSGKEKELFDHICSIQTERVEDMPEDLIVIAKELNHKILHVKLLVSF